MAIVSAFLLCVVIYIFTGLWNDPGYNQDVVLVITVVGMSVAVLAAVETFRFKVTLKPDGFVLRALRKRWIPYSEVTALQVSSDEVRVYVGRRRYVLGDGIERLDELTEEVVQRVKDHGVEVEGAV